MTTIDETIAARQQEFDALKEKMEDVRQRFVTAATPVVADWYRAFVKFEVEHNHTQTQSLSEDQIVEMRQAVTEVISAANRHTAAAFSTPDVWWHLQASMPTGHRSQPSHSYMVTSGSGPGTITGGLRRAYGHIGPIMSKYGYLSDETFGFHKWRKAGEELRYPFNVEWPKPLTALTTEYENLYNAAIAARRALNEAIEEKKRAEASKRFGDF